MSLTARQCRALDSIEQQLGAREPKLASMFAIFTRLTKDELLPTIEAVEVGRWRWRAELIDRLRRGRPRRGPRKVTQHRTTSAAVTRIVNVALVPFMVISLLVTALVVGGHGSPAGRCNRVASYHSLGLAGIAAANCGSWLSQSNHRHPQ